MWGYIIGKLHMMTSKRVVQNFEVWNRNGNVWNVYTELCGQKCMNKVDCLHKLCYHLKLIGAGTNCNRTTKVPEDSALLTSSNMEEVSKAGNGIAIMMVSTGNTQNRRSCSYMSACSSPGQCSWHCWWPCKWVKTGLYYDVEQSSLQED